MRPGDLLLVAATLRLLCCATGWPLRTPMRLYMCATGLQQTEQEDGEASRKNLRRIKADARGRRLNQLTATRLTPQEVKELDGLIRRGDTYNASDFSEAHRAFKAMHNDVFARLSLSTAGGKAGPVFYLEGPDGASTHALRAAGFATSDLHVANLFPATVEALVTNLGLSKVILAPAKEALSAQPWVGVPFSGYYLDGCGGSPEPIVAMCEAIFHPQRPLTKAIALGFSLTEAEPSGRSLPDREQAVVVAMNRAAVRHGYTLSRVGDDPELHLGQREPPSKKTGGTLTTWLLLRRSPGPSAIVGGHSLPGECHGF